ncbi:MAG: hypothetical protein R2932_06500 [Caldilineaceae bacterium]
MIRLWRAEWFQRTPPIDQVDFGNGHQVSAADLLDGHFRRLTVEADSSSSLSAEPQPDRFDDHLQQQIDAIVPTLTPLTDLAETLAHAMPDAEPTPYFRDTLNKALTQTHRQHHAQRVLGIRQTASEQDHWRVLFWVTFMLTVVSLGLVLIAHKSDTVAA